MTATFYWPTDIEWGDPNTLQRLLLLCPDSLLNLIDRVGGGPNNAQRLLFPCSESSLILIDR